MDSQSLLHKSYKELDELFGQAQVGEIPDGKATGTALIATATPLSQPIAEIIRLLAWKGKVFDAKAGILRNRTTPLGLEAVVARVYKGTSLFDKKECIVLDYSKTSLLAFWIRDEIRLVEPNFYLGKVYGFANNLVHFCLEF